MTPTRTIQRVLVVAIAFHLIFCASRIPSKAWRKRFQQVDKFRAEGPIRYFLADYADGTVEAVEWLAENTPERSIVLYRGLARSAIELANAALYPRLLFDANASSSESTGISGIPFASGTHPTLGTGTFVLISSAEGLRLTLR